MGLWGTVVATGVVDFWLAVVIGAAADVDFWVGTEGVVCVSIGAGCVGTCPGVGEVVTSGSVFLVAAKVAASEDSTFSVNTQIRTDVKNYVKLNK